MRTGPHGLTFHIETMTAAHSVERDVDGSLVIYRDCIVRTADGVRRMYGIRVDLLDGLL